MKIYRAGIVLSSVLLLGLTACGGGATDADADGTAPSATSPTPTVSATVDTEQGCDFTDNTGSSSNKKLQAFAVAQYQSLDCSSDIKLTEQLTALTGSAAFKKRVADQGWTASDGEALGAVSVALIDPEKRTACTISAVDSPARGKTVDCQSL